MLSHPSFALVEQGRLIKRRSVTGNWERFIRFPASADDVPMNTEQVHLAEPDSSMALPIALGIVDPRSALALNTLDELEKLWNARWFGGGYERYHSSGQVDQPGPWTFATCFILRAQHDAGLLDRSRRTLEWLNTVQGGRTGAWFEEIPLVRSRPPRPASFPGTRPSSACSSFVTCSEFASRTGKSLCGRRCMPAARRCAPTSGSGKAAYGWKFPRMAPSASLL